LWKNWPNPSAGAEYHEFKKSQLAKEPVPSNILRYTVNLEDAPNKTSSVGNHNHSKKASRKDVEELLTNFLARQTQSRVPTPPDSKGAATSSPSSTKKKSKKNKKHKKKHRKGKKQLHEHDDPRNSDDSDAQEENGEDSHDDEDDNEEEHVSDSPNSESPISADAEAAASNKPEIDAVADVLSSFALGNGADSDKTEMDLKEMTQDLVIVDKNGNMEEAAPTAVTLFTEEDGASDDSIVIVKNESDSSPETTETNSSSSKTKVEPTYKVTAGRKTCTLAAHRIQAGCTAVVALLVGDEIITANAGKTRWVLFYRVVS
jgi:hypothetical protein